MAVIPKFNNPVSKQSFSPFKFTQISPGDVPRTIQKLTFTLSDLPIELLKTALFRRNLTKYIKEDTWGEDCKSYLGTPVRDSIIFGDIDATSESNFYTEITGERKQIKPIRLNEALVTVTIQTNSVKTPIPGQSGTVKDYISTTDYQISIKGKISGHYNETTGLWEKPDGSYNVTSQKRLADLAKYHVTLPITCDFINLVFGVQNVVIDSIDIAAEAGGRNNPSFNISCTSDFKGANGNYELEIYDADIDNINEFVKRFI